MARVSRSGRTAASMRGTGRMTWPMEEADLSILMEMSTKENGLMINIMDKVLNNGTIIKSNIQEIS